MNGSVTREGNTMVFKDDSPEYTRAVGPYQSPQTRAPSFAAGVKRVSKNFCPQCGKKLAEDFHFCPQCGTSVGTLVLLPNQCSSCGSALGPQDKFCVSCGKER